MKLKRIALVIFMLLAPTYALANVDDDHKSHTMGLGIKGVYAMGLQAEHFNPHGGIGAGIHTLLIPNWLELELAMKIVLGKHGIHVPLEIMLRKPFHLGEKIHLSIGVGPIAALNFNEGKVCKYSFGAGADIAFAYWFREWGGWSVAIGYEIMYEGHWVHGMVVSSGPVFSW